MSRVLRKVEGTKSAKSPYMYETEDKRIFVMCHTGRSWSGTHGSYSFREWHAFLRGQVDSSKNEAEYMIARGATLEQCEKNVAKYLADEAAGTLKNRGSYGFAGDQRPVAREKKNGS